MTEFNKGWWSCFISFAGELILSSASDTRELTNVLCGAGVDEDEIQIVLEEYWDIISEPVANALREYTIK